MRAKSLRWCVMISGRGSNLQSLLDSFDPLNVVLIVASNAEALGRLKAKRYGIPILDFAIHKKNWPDLLQIFKQRKIEGLFLAGFMKILPETVIATFHNCIVNIHPSLLPNYPGLNSFERALADGVRTGASVHYVDAGVDTGKIIRQKKLSQLFHIDELNRAQLQLTTTEKFLTTAVLRSHWPVPHHNSSLERWQ